LLIYEVSATDPPIVAYLVEAKWGILLRRKHGLAGSNDDYNPDAAVTTARKPSCLVQTTPFVKN
jgi:hypothetical protein